MQHEHLAQAEEEPFTPCLEENPLKEPPHEENEPRDDAVLREDAALNNDPQIDDRDEEYTEVENHPSKDLFNEDGHMDECQESEPSASIDEDSTDSDANAPLIRDSVEKMPIKEQVSVESEKELSKGKDKSHRQYFEAFTTDLANLTDSDSKLQFAIDFMENSLSQSGVPHFKSFWEARAVCLELFKEAVSPLLRANLWTKYNELSKEARRLKEILDEQSAFAVEQIEMAIKALEDDIESFEELVQKMIPVEFSVTSKIMCKRLSHYQKFQGQLNLLNTQAARINGLRKELIRTEMRVRQKNKFFQRLSAAGDKVFPHRKDLIKEVSEGFAADVDAFIGENFTRRDNHESLFSLREEIKSLQQMAKVLTLNTHAFTQTRMRLSECWDLIKNEEKDRKKERSQQKAIFKQNVEDGMEKLRAFTQAFQLGELSNAEADKQLDEIFAYLRGLELGRDEQRYLSEELNNARRPLMEKIQTAESERRQSENERETNRQEEINSIKLRINELLTDNESLDGEALAAERGIVLERMNSTSMSKAEKMEIERMLKPLRDLITEKKESSLMSLSDDDREALQKLKEILAQRKERRQEIKNQIEIYRKASGASGLDFEQAMTYNVQLAEEKERLEKMVHGIKEIEKKIAELEKR